MGLAGIAQVPPALTLTLTLAPLLTLTPTLTLTAINQASEAEARRAAIEEARLEPARRDVELAARAAEEQARTCRAHAHAHADAVHMPCTCLHCLLRLT